MPTAHTLRTSKTSKAKKQFMRKASLKELMHAYFAFSDIVN